MDRKILERRLDSSILGNRANLCWNPMSWKYPKSFSLSIVKLGVKTRKPSFQHYTYQPSQQRKIQHSGTFVSKTAVLKHALGHCVLVLFSTKTHYILLAVYFLKEFTLI